MFHLFACFINLEIGSMHSWHLNFRFVPLIACLLSQVRWHAAHLSLSFYRSLSVFNLIKNLSLAFHHRYDSSRCDVVPFVFTHYCTLPICECPDPRVPIPCVPSLSSYLTVATVPFASSVSQCTTTVPIPSPTVTLYPSA